MQHHKNPLSLELLSSKKILLIKSDVDYLSSGSQPGLSMWNQAMISLIRPNQFTGGFINCLYICLLAVSQLFFPSYKFSLFRPWKKNQVQLTMVGKSLFDWAAHNFQKSPATLSIFPGCCVPRVQWCQLTVFSGSYILKVLCSLCLLSPWSNVLMFKGSRGPYFQGPMFLWSNIPKVLDYVPRSFFAQGPMFAGPCIPKVMCS